MKNEPKITVVLDLGIGNGYGDGYGRGYGYFNGDGGGYGDDLIHGHSHDQEAMNEETAVAVEG